MAANLSHSCDAYGQEESMFANLEEQMKHDDAAAISPRQSIISLAVIVFVAVAVFGALYYALQSVT